MLWIELIGENAIAVPGHDVDGRDMRGGMTAPILSLSEAWYPLFVNDTFNVVSLDGVIAGGTVSKLKTAADKMIIEGHCVAPLRAMLMWAVTNPGAVWKVEERK